MQFKDHFSKQANIYAQFRPTYPEELFTYLSSLCKEHELAWDCATGNGQAANSLVSYFNHVIATDASEAQLKNAKQHEKIAYKLALAEESGIESGTVDIVTVATAIHWFNFDKFYAEVNRVLKPGGILAVWTYCDPIVNTAIDAVVDKLHNNILFKYWLKENWMVSDKYKDLPFPYERIRTPQFTCSKMGKLKDLEGLLESWSATQSYIKANNKDPIDQIKDELSNAWGKDEAKEIRWDLTLIVGRK
jgi:ubiquinone/menaquinone biosynthesis C-methylase UbiE